MSRESPTKNHHSHNPKKLPYAKITNAVIVSPHISSSDLRVYSVICTHYNSITGKTFPSIAKIAQEAGFHINTVKESRSTLRELGIIKWRLVRTEKNSCQYELPLFSGSYEEQQRVIETLRLGRKTTQPNRVEKQANGRAEKQANGRVEKQATNKKKELEEINNNRHEVVLPLTLQNQVQEQIAYFQDAMKEWDLSSEGLKPFDLLETLLWVGYIRSRISDGYKVPNPAGYLLSSLRSKGRSIADREEKVGEVMEEWIPEHLLVVHQDEYWFPRWRYLEELSQEHKKPVSDLLKEGILGGLTIRDEDRDEPLLDEFKPEELEILREGKFEEKLSEHKKELAKQEAQIKVIKEWRERPEEFFAEVVKPMMKGGE